MKKEESEYIESRSLRKIKHSAKFTNREMLCAISLVMEMVQISLYGVYVDEYMKQTAVIHVL